MRALEPWHLVILAIVFVALFGAKRLPDTARSLGESLHIFKKSIRPEEPAPPAAAPVLPPAEPRGQINASVGVPKPEEHGSPGPG